MKKSYCTPALKFVLFEMEEILAPSGGESPILDPHDKNNPDNPAKEFGNIQLF